MTPSPCKNCFDRTITCHGVCRRYQAWKAEREETLARIREENEKNYPISDRSKRVHWKNMRQANRKYVVNKK